MNQESQTWRCCILLTILCMCCKDFHSLLVLMKKTLFYPELHHLKGQSFIEQQERPKRQRRRGRRPKKDVINQRKRKGQQLMTRLHLMMKVHCLVTQLQLIQVVPKRRNQKERKHHHRLVYSKVRSGFRINNKEKLIKPGKDGKQKGGIQPLRRKKDFPRGDLDYHRRN